MAAETGTPLVDVQALFAARSPGEITGDAWLVDHVHPSISGHKLIATCVARRDGTPALGVLPPGTAGRPSATASTPSQLASLDDFYFLKGEQRLKNLKGWAQGRACTSAPASRNQPPSLGSRDLGRRFGGWAGLSDFYRDVDSWNTRRSTRICEQELIGETTRIGAQRLRKRR